MHATRHPIAGATGGWSRFQVPTFADQSERVSYFSEPRGGVGR